MSASLSPACNPSKQAFDTCFNHWFKSYLLLISPPLSHPMSTPLGTAERELRNKAIAEKKAEYDDRCGAVYGQYQACLKTGIAANPELSELLESARKEEPLTGWGAIKVVTEEDLRE